MKKHLRLLSLALLILAIFESGRVCAYEETFSTGRDWVQRMSKKEKFIAVFAPMILFLRYGVPFQKKPNEYIDVIDQALMVNPYLESEDVANIFASTVYAYEPGSRPAFDAMAREFHYRNVGNKEIFYPYLTLRPLSKRQSLASEDEN